MAVDYKYVFKIKGESEDRGIIYKARLVASGFSQRQGVDCEEIFSPVVRYSMMRLLIALAVEMNLTVDRTDVVTVLLCGDIETMYM